MQTHIGSLLMQNVELTYFQARSIACVCLMKFAYGSRSKLSTTCQTFLHRMENLKTRRCKRKRNNSYQMLRAEAGGGNKQQEQPFRRNMFRSLHADQKIVSQVRYFCILHCLYFVYVQIHILSCCTFPGHSQRLILIAEVVQSTQDAVQMSVLRSLFRGSSIMWLGSSTITHLRHHADARRNSQSYIWLRSAGRHWRGNKKAGEGIKDTHTRH